MPSADEARLVVEGREEVAEVRESVRVVRRDGRVAGVAMLGKLFEFLEIFSIYEYFQ